MSVSKTGVSWEEILREEYHHQTNTYSTGNVSLHFLFVITFVTTVSLHFYVVSYLNVDCKRWCKVERRLCETYLVTPPYFSTSHRESLGPYLNYELFTLTSYLLTYLSTYLPIYLPTWLFLLYKSYRPNVRPQTVFWQIRWDSFSTVKVPEFKETP